MARVPKSKLHLVAGEQFAEELIRACLLRSTTVIFEYDGRNLSALDRFGEIVYTKTVPKESQERITKQYKSIENFSKSLYK